ncbi:MAG TPA: SIMPL domain-containing protein [Polyangiaceae bacterium]|nr:SIMPL domain-containing protein [Polyangiaceae bacterium]
MHRAFLPSPSSPWAARLASASSSSPRAARLVSASSSSPRAARLASASPSSPRAARPVSASSSSPRAGRYARLRPSAAALTLALGALGALGAGCAPGRTIVVTGSEQSPLGVLVTGEGKATAPPDVARMSLQVEARSNAVEQASDEVTAKMAAVIATLKAAGIEERDLRTSQLSIRREVPSPGYPMPYPVSYAAPENAGPAPAVMAPAVPTVSKPAAPTGTAKPPSPAPTMKPPSVPPRAPMAPVMVPPPSNEVYVVSNSLEICVRDLKRLGPVLTAATRAGVNGLSGPSFEREDDTALERQAREKALQNARTRAEQLARVAGVKLGPVISINDAQQGGFEIGYATPRAVSVHGGQMPVQPGEIQVVRHVQVRFSLATND